MTLPAAFGQSWEQFVADWCLGVEPSGSNADTVSALATLARLLPEHVQRLTDRPQRGLAFVARAVHLGLVLGRCEQMKGFEALLLRMRKRERSAFVEAHYAAALTRFGCEPELEPPSGTGLLDTAVTWAGTRILSEVISPEQALAIVQVQQDVEALAHALRGILTDSTVEVLLDTDLTPEVRDRVLEIAPTLPVGELTAIANLGTLIRRPGSVPLQLGPTLIKEGDSPVIGAAAGHVQAGPDHPLGVGAGGIVRMPILDDRARRLLSAELHHFSRDMHNVLAINITGIAVGPKNWAPLIRRSFQPNQNRRVGAVVLLSTGLTGAPMTVREAWAVIPNPHALRPIPVSFLEGLAGLDESSYFRGTPPDAAA